MMSIRDVAVGPVIARIYEPDPPSSGQGLVWAHGGGFRGGSLDMPEADAVGRALAENGHTVVSAGYRLVDGVVRYPAPSDDVLRVWTWATQTVAAPARWHLGGASAGGNLAAGVALRLRDDRMSVPCSLVLAYPTLHRVQPASPAVDAVADRIPESQRWDAERIAEMYVRYIGGSVDARYAVPGDSDLTGLPPTFLIASEYDDLRRSAEGFHRALQAAHVPHRYVIEPGALHGHLNRPEEPFFAHTVGLIDDWLRREG